MGYALDSDDPEELACYNWLIKEIHDMRKDSIIMRYHLIGISQWEYIDKFEYFFSNRWEPYPYLSAIAVDYSYQKNIFLNTSLFIISLTIRLFYIYK